MNTTFVRIMKIKIQMRNKAKPNNYLVEIKTKRKLINSKLF